MKVHPNRADRPMLAPQVRITPWLDPTIDALGHDVLDRDNPKGQPPYVETFWLPLIGPTATFLLRRCVQQLEGGTDTPIPTELLSQGLGLGSNINRNSKLADTISRAERFKFAFLPMRGDELAIRTHLPPVPLQMRHRLPPALQALHEHVLATNQPVPAERRVPVRSMPAPPKLIQAHLTIPPAAVQAVSR